MRRILSLFVMSAFMLTLSTTTMAADHAKAEKRASYTIKNLSLNEAQQKTLKPLLLSYISELKAAKKKYSDMKDKYEKEISKKTLTDAEASSLLSAKWECEAKELEIKKSYAKKFAATLSPKKVFLCFSLLNDKMSKIEGKKNSKKKEADDDDE